MTESQYKQAVQEIEQKCVTPSAKPWSRPLPARVCLPDRRSRIQSASSRCARPGPSVHQRRRGRAEHGLGGSGPRRVGVSALGLQHRAVRLCPAVRADPQRRLPSRLPVVLVGNGGGYGYGVMGATHHALEDYGALLCLPHLRAYVPAFDQDLRVQIDSLFAIDTPRLSSAGALRGAKRSRDSAVLRLAQAAGWARLARTGGRAAGRRHLERRAKLDGASRPTLWALSELPCSPIPEEFLADLLRSRRLLVVEEHVEQGGVGQRLALALAIGRDCSSAVRRADRPRAISSGRYRLAGIPSPRVRARRCVDRRRS